jgi:hypothetical protein
MLLNSSKENLASSTVSKVEVNLGAMLWCKLGRRARFVNGKNITERAQVLIVLNI